MKRRFLIPLAAGALLAAGAVAPAAQAAPAATGDVQLVTPWGVQNQFQQTVRHADGNWQAWDRSNPSSVDGAIGMKSVMINGVDHVFYAGTTTHQPSQYLYRHLTHDANGWSSNGTLPAGMVEDLGVGVANLNGHIALVEHTGGDVTRLSVQQNDGTWSAWENVPVTGRYGDFSLTAAGGVLRLVVVSADGTQIGDYERAADGTWSQPNWTPFNGGTAGQVAVAQVGADLQVVVRTSSPTKSEVWHAIRHANGSWDRFGYVEGVAGDIPDADYVSVTAARGELQLAVSTFGGSYGLYHTIRHADGTWQRFGDVTSVVGPVDAMGVTIAGE